MLDTTNPNNYEYTTKHLEIHVLGGIKLNKLESLRITLSIQKPNQPRSRTIASHGLLHFNKVAYFLSQIGLGFILYINLDFLKKYYL